MRFLSARCLVAFAVLGVFSAARVPEVAAQERSGTQIGPFSFNGLVSLQAEAYGTRGVAARRDPYSMQGALRFTAGAGKYFTYGANFVFSTQQVSFGRQGGALPGARSLNRGSLDLGYRWARVSAGNIVPALSKYTLQDVTVRGGLLELTPGPLLMTFAAGRARGAEAGNALDRVRPAYERWIYAGRLGYGKQQGGHLHLIGLYGLDDATSLQPATTARPAENLNVAADAGLSLFNRAVSLRGLGAVSAFTEDTGADPFALGDTGVPGFVGDVLAINASTRVSFAGELEGDLRLQQGQVRLGYERVQPGYQAMGLARPNDDRAQIRAQGRVQLMQRRLQLEGRFNQSRNNLLDLLGATTIRRQMAASARLQVTEAVGAGLSYAALQNRLDVEAGSTAGRNAVTHTVTASPSVSLSRGEVRHTGTLGLTYGWRPAETGGGVAARGFQNATAVAAYTAAFPSRLALSVNANATRVEVANVTSLSSGVTLLGRRPFMEGRLTLSLSAAYAFTRSDQPSLQVPNSVHRQTVQARAQWAVPFGGDLGVSLRGLNVSGRGTSAVSYQEFRAVATYQRRL